MEKEKSYDAMVIFDRPVNLKTDDDQTVTIYGITYNMAEAHKNDLGIWCLNRYISYLEGVYRVQKNGGKIAPELIITSFGRDINLTNEIKNLIYRIMRDKMTSYRVYESDSPLQLEPDECDGNLIISKALIDRYLHDTKKANKK